MSIEEASQSKARCGGEGVSCLPIETQEIIIAAYEADAYVAERFFGGEPIRRTHAEIMRSLGPAKERLAEHKQAMGIQASGEQGPKEKAG